MKRLLPNFARKGERTKETGKFSDGAGTALQEEDGGGGKETSRSRLRGVTRLSFCSSALANEGNISINYCVIKI